MKDNLHESKRKEIERVLSAEKPIFKHKGAFTADVSQRISALLEERIVGQDREILLSNKAVDYGTLTQASFEEAGNIWRLCFLAYSGWDRDIERTPVLVITNPHDFKLYEHGFIVVNADAIEWNDTTHTSTETPVLAFL